MLCCRCSGLVGSGECVCACVCACVCGYKVVGWTSRSTWTSWRRQWTAWRTEAHGDYRQQFGHITLFCTRYPLLNAGAYPFLTSSLRLIPFFAVRHGRSAVVSFLKSLQFFLQIFPACVCVTVRKFSCNATLLVFSSLLVIFFPSPAGFGREWPETCTKSRLAVCLIEDLGDSYLWQLCDSTAKTRPPARTLTSAAWRHTMTRTTQHYAHAKSKHYSAHTPWHTITHATQHYAQTIRNTTAHTACRDTQ